MRPFIVGIECGFDLILILKLSDPLQFLAMWDEIELLARNLRSIRKWNGELSAEWKWKISKPRNENLIKFTFMDQSTI